MKAYVLKIRKSFGGRNAKNSWVNNYHLISEVPLVDPQWIDVVNKFAGMEKAFHLGSVHFLSAIVSTWDVEEHYEFENLRTFTLQGVGGVDEMALRQGYPESGGSITADLNFALQMNKNVTLGRAGKMFYRGALVWPDIVVDGNGKPTLTAQAQARIQGNIPNAMALISEVTSIANWVMLPVAKTVREQNPDDDDPGTPGHQVELKYREVLGLGAGGVILNKRDHKYFDRGPRTTGVQDDGA